MVKTAEPVLTLNAQSDARMQGFASVHQMLLESVVCVPILAPRGEAIGALYLETRVRPGAHFERELPTLRAFADQVAIALENARLINENKQRADALATANSALEEAQERLRELLDGRTEQLKRARKSSATRVTRCTAILAIRAWSARVKRCAACTRSSIACETPTCPC